MLENFDTTRRNRAAEYDNCARCGNKKKKTAKMCRACLSARVLEKVRFCQEPGRGKRLNDCIVHAAGISSTVSLRLHARWSGAY